MPYKLTTTIEGSSCRIIIERMREGVILMRIAGYDVGEFRDVPMRCIESLIPRDGNFVLYIDGREVRGVTVDVSGTWAHWLSRNRHLLTQVHMLTSSRLVGVNAEFVRRFTALDEQMTLHTNASDFERSLIQASV